jgi:Mg2+ and Co2+ transporter CorA
MSINSKLMKYALMGVVGVLAFVSIPAMAAPTRQENEQLTKLLGEANEAAATLAKDANDTGTLVWLQESYESHAAKLDQVADDVNAMARIVAKLTELRSTGSDLQEQAADRILPLLTNLAENTTAAIKYLNQNQGIDPPSEAYKQYLRDNDETAQHLSSTVSSLFEYEKSMAKVEKYKKSLEIERK